MRKVLLTIFCLYTYGIIAQNQRMVDSLESVLKGNQPDTAKVWTLLGLGFEYRSADVSKAEKYIDDGLKLAEKISFKPGIALAYNHYGILYKNKKNFEEAIKWHMKSLALKEQLHDRDGMASSYNNLGLTYSYKGDYDKAVEYLLKYLKICEEDKYTKGIGTAYDNLANVYENRGDFDRALLYAEKSLNIRRAGDDSMALGRQLYTTGFLYYEKNQHGKALSYYKEAASIFKILGDDFSLSDIYANMGNILVETGKVDEGLKYQQLGLELTRESENHIGEMTALLSLGQGWSYKGDYTKALDFTLKGIDMARTLQSLEAEKDGYEVLTEIYNKKGDFKKALESHYKFTTLKDSLIRADNTHIMEELQAKYETEKKDHKIKETTLERDNAQLSEQRQRTINIVLVSALALLALMAWLIYNRYKLKQQKKLDDAMIRQQELRSKAVLEAEERERIRIAKDLHDGVGQLLSAARMQVSLVEPANSQDEAQKAAYQNAIELLDESAKEVRAVSHSMMPNALLRSGLVAAVREFVGRVSNERLKVDLEIVGLNERLDTTVESVLFRIMQELVSNIVKHAGATRVSIQLIRHESEILLMVEDDGHGFNVPEMMNSEKAGIGLKNIVSRAEFLDGTAVFDSFPGKGTTVTIEVPVG